MTALPRQVRGRSFKQMVPPCIQPLDAPRPSEVPVLVPLPPGWYWMGESRNDKFATDTERPRHRVTISHSFALGRTPVTNEEFRAFSPGHGSGEPEDWPVVNVDWEDAQDYCGWLSEGTGKPFRLPSEAEWEYACRAGTESCFSTGEDIGLNDANFLYSEQGEHIGLGSRQGVGLYPPNAYGLCDFHGQVCEWVEDSWHPSYHGAPADGSAWIDGDAAGLRVIRGGAWDYLPRLLRSAWRDAVPVGQRRDNLGFRLAMTLPR